MKTYLIILLFLFSSVSGSALTGYWERMHPELNGEVPNARGSTYTCPIGERKVLMLNGDGSGNPHYYKDTWLYHYDEDRWQRIQCDSQPDTYMCNPMVQKICQVNKNAVMVMGMELESGSNDSYVSASWLFILDSLEWYRPLSFGNISLLDEVNINYAENKIMGYRVGFKEYKFAHTTLIELDIKNPVNTATTAKWEIVIEEGKDKGNYGPATEINTWAEVAFLGTELNAKEPLLFVPKGSVFMYLDTTEWQWKKIESPSSAAVERQTASNLVGNAILGRKRYENTYEYYCYDTTNKIMNVYQINNLNPKPLNGDKLVKIKDSVSMLFCGPNGQEGQTWIFRLTDTASAIDTAGEDTGHIFYVGNNSYFLKEIESAELYDLQGILMGKYYDNGVVDLNKYVNGAYLLRYTTDGKKYRTEKIIKK